MGRSNIMLPSTKVLSQHCLMRTMGGEGVTSQVMTANDGQYSNQVHQNT